MLPLMLLEILYGQVMPQAAFDGLDATFRDIREAREFPGRLTDQVLYRLVRFQPSLFQFLTRFPDCGVYCGSTAATLLCD